MFLLNLLSLVWANESLCFCQVFHTRLLLQQPKHLDFCLYFYWPGFHFSKFTACELLLENSNVQNIREALSRAVLLICALSSLLTVSKMWVQQCPEQQLHQPRCAVPVGRRGVPPFGLWSGNRRRWARESPQQGREQLPWTHSRSLAEKEQN